MKLKRKFFRMAALVTMVCALICTVALNGGIASACAAGTLHHYIHNGELAGTVIGTYTGEQKNGMAHGSGTLEFDYGAVYKGKFEYGYPCGYGTYTYEDGTSVSGNWAWGTASGSLDSSRKGTTLAYQGMFCDDTACGYGEMSMEKCGIFYGEFYDGDADGWGLYVYDSPMPQSQPYMEGDDWEIVYDSYKYGHRYNGLALDGFWQGFGIGVMDNGNYYVGEIRNEYRSGYGRVYLSSGSVYQKGVFQDGGLVYPD